MPVSANARENTMSLRIASVLAWAWGILSVLTSLGPLSRFDRLGWAGPHNCHLALVRRNSSSCSRIRIAAPTCLRGSRCNNCLRPVAHHSVDCGHTSASRKWHLGSHYLDHRWHTDPLLPRDTRCCDGQPSRLEC